MEISDVTISENQSEKNIQEQDEEKLENEELEDEELDDSSSNSSQSQEQLEEKLIEVIEEEVIKEVKETEENKRDEEIDERIATFLHEKGLSENLVKTLINAGITDELIRLTKIDKLQSYFSCILIKIVIYIQNVKEIIFIHYINKI